MDPSRGLENFELLQDALVTKELENIGFRDIVNRKFEELNMGIEQTVMPIMKKTQDVLDEILEDVKLLEAEEKLLSKELHSIIAPDVIVLDDDDEVEEPKGEVSGESENLAVGVAMGSPSRSTAEARSNFPKVERGYDCLGLRTGMRVLAKKRTQWYPATIIDILIQEGDKTRYKVRYDMNRGKSKLAPNHLAWLDTSHRYLSGQISVGSRIAAHFKDEEIYSGTVAEVPDRKSNRSRFLIFFDDGYAMYCPIDTIYLVCRSPARVWHDISNRETAEYMQKYLSMSERLMLTMKPNQILKVEFDGEWHRAKCTKVDCSLVEVMYLMDNSREWIYRGSLRLEPLHKQSQNKMQNKSQRKLARAHTGVRNAHIEYATIDLTRDSSPSPTNSPTHDPTQRRLFLKEMEDRRKNVGKKSTGGIPKIPTNIPDELHSYRKSDGGWEAPWVKSLAAQKPPSGSSPVTRLPQSFSEIRGGVDVASHILNRISVLNKRERERWSKRDSRNGRGWGPHRSKSSDDRTDADFPFGKSVKMDPDQKRTAFGPRSQNFFMMQPRNSAPYRVHQCSAECIKPFHVSDLEKLKGVNPLMKPLLLGWTREGSRKPPCGEGPAFHAYYRAPCGRMCRDMRDIERYMIMTGLTDLDYDQFCFDYSIRSQSNIPVHSRDAKLFIEDYAEGKEDIPIPCVNEINAEKPPKMPYTKARIAGTGVSINTSSDYMVCCDCDNNCRDRSKCPCQQLTVAATSCCKGGKVKADAGYLHKRLHSFLPTGIYECNDQCKCNARCPNRVVQKGLQCRMQMFKTHKKGWGIRCLDDIMKGTFICIYAGKIQTEEQANEEGLANGDEYLAELDHIEVAERQKDVEDDLSSSGVDSEMDEDEEEVEKAKNLDSGADTTDSEAGGEEKQKHLTVTLQRAHDSKWTVKSDDASFSVEDKFSEKSVDAKKESSGMGKPSSVRRKLQSKKPGERDSSDSEIDSTSAPQSQLAPPGGGNEEDADETTDTDTDFSNNENSRPPSPFGSTASKNQDRRSSHGIGLNSSKMRAYGKLPESTDHEDHISQTRRYFGCTDIFIIDAKQTGNIGRYLNHSCSPNLLVQNVFVDTHDLRFPWVAFFATSNIRAGTELTWDYNYEVGSVEGREIPCYCGATKCRKRLL